MKRFLVLLLLSSPLYAQVQIGKGVSIGAGAGAQFITSLTTTGTGGAATVSAGVLNIPNYTFSFTLGSTSIAGGSTVTAVTGLSVNGVTLTSGGSAANCLNGTGAYTACGGSGGGNTTSTSLTNNVLPKANGANSIINSGLSDNGTTLSYSGSGTTNGISFPASTTPFTPASGVGFYGTDSSGNTIVSENGAALSRICTAANGICTGGAATGYGGVNTFGDSITDGVGSSTVRQGGAGAKGFAWQLINTYGSGTNYGAGGDQAGDLAVKINNVTPQASNNFLTTIMVSTNDVNVYGSSAPLQTVFQNALAYSAAYAAIPENAKLHFANGATPNGSCTFTSSNANAWQLEQRAGFVISAMQTPAPIGTSDGSAATCTFTTYQSGPIYLAYLIYNGWFSGSTMSVTVDGGAATVFNTNPTGSTSITTFNGQAFFPVLGRIAGPFAAGTHTVVVTLGGGNINDAAELYWLGSPYPASGSAGNNAAPPDVFVGGTPWQQNDTGEPLTGTYNTLIQSTVSTLTGDGLPVHFVNIRAFLNSTTDFNGGTLANGVICPVSALNPLHPGDCGHAHLAQAFLSSMPASNFSGPLNGPLTYYGPVRSTTGGGGWLFGNPSAWQVGTSIGSNGSFSGCTMAGGIATGCISSITTTVGTTAIAANTCTAATTVTMTGVATTTTFAFTPNADVSGVTGWGASGGLTIDAWPTANTLNFKICNQTSASITPSASVTFNVSAR